MSIFLLKTYETGSVSFSVSFDLNNLVKQILSRKLITESNGAYFDTYNEGVLDSIKIGWDCKQYSRWHFHTRSKLIVGNLGPIL